MKHDDKQQPAIVRGGTNDLAVLVSPDHQAMGLKFDLIRTIEGRETTIPMEVVFDTPVGMGLLLNLQEIQRVFGLPIPEGGTLSMTKEKEPQD